MKVTVRLPMRLKPEGNARGEAQKRDVALMLRQYAPALRDQGFPVTCTLTRFSFGKLARELGVDDGGDDVEWVYRQMKGLRGVHEVEIVIEPRLVSGERREPGPVTAVKSGGRR